MAEILFFVSPEAATKRSSQKFCKIHRKTLVPESLYLTKLHTEVFKETLTHGFCYEFCKISKNTFLQNSSGELLLSVKSWRNWITYILKPNFSCKSWVRFPFSNLVMLLLKLIEAAKEVFLKKAVLINFAIITGKYVCWSLFLKKLQAWRHATLIERDSNTGVFLWILRNF